MIIFETMGLFIVAFGCIAALVFICSVFLSGSPENIDEGSIAASLLCVIAFLLFITSILFVQFRHYPEKFGYTAIEEVEEVEETE